MNKVIVKRVVKGNDGQFHIIVNGSYETCTVFRLDAPPGDTWHEELNREMAIQIAKKHENPLPPIEEIIYESPDPELVPEKELEDNLCINIDN